MLDAFVGAYFASHPPLMPVPVKREKTSNLNMEMPVRCHDDAVIIHFEAAVCLAPACMSMCALTSHETSIVW